MPWFHTFHSNRKANCFDHPSFYHVFRCPIKQDDAIGLSSHQRCGKQSTMGFSTVPDSRPAMGEGAHDVRHNLGEGAHGVPHNATIAVLLLGETFRGVTSGNPCTEASIRDQKEATLSYLKNIVRPLQRNNNTVHLFYTQSNCTKYFTDHMARWLNDTAKAHVTFDSRFTNAPTFYRYEQQNWRMGWRLLSKHAAHVDYVFQGRNDIMVPDPITSWPSDFSKLLFEQEGRYCRSACNVGGHLRTIKKSCPEYSAVCSATRFAWFPKKDLRRIFFISSQQEFTHGYQEWGDLFLRNFASMSYSFLFPDCEKFKSALACDPWSLYRPLGHPD